MRSPARLVTGTAAAALTAAALGLTAAPSAHADVTGFGRPGLTAAVQAPGTVECGSEYPGGAASPDAAADCGTEDTTAAAGDPAPADDLEPAAELDAADEADALEDPAATGPLDEAGDPAALSGSLRPETDDDPPADDPGAGIAEKPGTRPEPLTPPGADPGHAKPPTGRPTTPPGNRPSQPSGHVGTGVGGSAAPDTAQLAAGAGLVAAAAGSGVLLLRRRRSDGTHG